MVFSSLDDFKSIFYHRKNVKSYLSSADTRSTYMYEYVVRVGVGEFARGRVDRIPAR